MINQDVNCGSFMYCTTHWGPHERKKFHNVGNGLWHQYTYLIDGQLEIEFRDSEDGEITSTFNSRDYKHDGSEDDNRLLDHLPLGKYETIITESEGSTAMFFNPIAETRLLKVDILREGTHQVGPSDKRITIICVQKYAHANDSRMISMQHATVWPGKMANLVIPKDGVCATVCYSDDADQIIEHMYKR